MNKPRTFTLYRRVMPAHGVANPTTEPQLEGCLFSDSTVAVRWLTEHRSMSVWENIHEFYAVHVDPHPDYETEMVWHE